MNTEGYQLTQAECDRLPSGAVVHVAWAGGNSGVYSVTEPAAGGRPARLATMPELRAGLPGGNYLGNVGPDPKVHHRATRLPWETHPWQQDFPYSQEVYAVLLPDSDEDAVVKAVTGWLDGWHRKFGGEGLRVVLRGPNVGGRVTWLVDPVDRNEYTAKTMALVAVKLRQLENRQLGL